VTIDRGGDRGHHVHETRPVRDLHAEAAKIAGEVGATRRERDLRQKPEGMEKCRIVRGRLEGRLGGIRGGCCDHIYVGTEPQFVDDLVPLPRLRQDA